MLYDGSQQDFSSGGHPPQSVPTHVVAAPSHQVTNSMGYMQPVQGGQSAPYSSQVAAVPNQHQQPIQPVDVSGGYHSSGYSQQQGGFSQPPPPQQQQQQVFQQTYQQQPPPQQQQPQQVHPQQLQHQQQLLQQHHQFHQPVHTQTGSPLLPHPHSPSQTQHHQQPAMDDTASVSSFGNTLSVSSYGAKSSHTQESSIAGELERLGVLKQHGVLDEAEFAAVKGKLLSGYAAEGSSSNMQAAGGPKGKASIHAGHVPDPDDWECTSCGNVNWAARTTCNRCKKKKGKGDKTQGSSIYGGSKVNSRVKRIVVNVGSMRRTATSCSGCTPGDGRLNSSTAWHADMSQSNHWYCMDAGSVRIVCGIVMKSSPQTNSWVSAFTVTSSTDGVTWRNVDDKAVFSTCDERDSNATTSFMRPIRARYVKIHPVSWSGRISMRVGLLLCALGGGTAIPQQPAQTTEVNPDKEQAREAAREKLENFFSMHNPSKLSNIAAILNYCETSGVEYASLYRRLEAKYAHAARDPRDQKITILRTSDYSRTKVKADWSKVSVKTLKEIIAKKWNIPVGMQVLTNRSGDELEDESLMCSNYDVMQGTLIFVDVLGSDDDASSDSGSVLSIPNDTTP